MTKNLGVKLLGGAAIAGLLIGCPTSPDEGPCEGAQCVGSSEGGGPDGPLADGDVPDVDVPGCDLSKAPKDSPACLDDKAGVFVSPSGSDDAAGTRDKPVKTIPKAVALAATSRRPRVYICEGTYPENLTVTGPVSLYGGLTCAWAPADVTPLLAPPKGVALRITTVAAPIVVQDLAITGSADTAVPGDSAVAVFVVGSPAVTLRHVALRAGPGVAGKGETKAADGALLSSTPTAASINGNGGGPTNGGLAQTCTCVGGATSKGGGGGNTGADGSPGETAYVPSDPSTATGAASTVVECSGGQGGRTGSNAPAGGAGAGATTLGTLTAAGWAPQPGADAAAYGSPGQGGGGGGGSGGGGGGGACGGCGGAPGKAGGGGGASLALLALDSPVALLASSLTTADAGNAAPGAQGGDGLAGGTKGTQGGGACPGGNGGKGGAGGAGGGGAGGISAGVLAKGKPPTLDQATTAATLLGKKGDPGGGNGIDGQSAPLVTLP